MSTDIDKGMGIASQRGWIEMGKGENSGDNYNSKTIT